MDNWPRRANVINTVHLACVRVYAKHAPIGARRWIPAVAAGLPQDLEFRTRGQLAIDIAAEVLAEGTQFDFFCGD